MLAEGCVNVELARISILLVVINSMIFYKRKIVIKCKLKQKWLREEASPSPNVRLTVRFGSKKTERVKKTPA